jgi:hypothetical protein
VLKKIQSILYYPKSEFNNRILFNQKNEILIGYILISITNKGEEGICVILAGSRNLMLYSNINYQQGGGRYLCDSSRFKKFNIVKCENDTFVV